MNYAVTTDIWELAEGEYFQAEFMKTVFGHSAWAARLGIYRKIEDSEMEYGEGLRRWEAGLRWRYFLLETSPHLLFLGGGVDHRPDDNSITPTGEVGFNLCFKPAVVSVIGFAGYQVHFHGFGFSKDRWVKGIELRAGFCF
ncbi:hypothetical protein KGY73_11400 [bacterium]|nr:hypothetical protein [bacterium]